MREMLELSAEPRAKLGKGPAYQMRKTGNLPAIIYGGASQPLPVQINERNFGKLYQSGSLLQSLMMLDVDGKKTRVIPRAIQLDPVTDRPVHVDFLRLEAGATLRIFIPVHFKGQEISPGIKKGGVLNIVRHEIELYCKVEEIPEHLEADLGELDIGDSIHISAISLPPGVKTVIQGRNFTIATLAPPTTYVEETPTAAAAATAEGATTAEGAAPAGGAAAAAAAPAAADKGKAPQKK